MIADGSERERLFFALWPDEETRAALARLARKLVKGRGRLVTQETLHITLFFLGSIDRSARETAVSVADAISAPAFELHLDRLGAWRGPGVAWSGPSRIPGELNRLVGALRAGLEGKGFVADLRPYYPHVTLARKVHEDWESHPHPAIRWPVSAFYLVRSFTEQTGVRYEPQRFWPLAGDALGPPSEIWDTAPKPDR